MMRFTDAVILAYTKLKTRKVRLFFALLTSSLLFSILVAGSLIVNGALQSLDSFSKEGFSDRYIISGIYQNFTDIDSMVNDKELIARAEQLQKEDIAAKKAAAKTLNIPFDDKNISEENKAIYEAEGEDKRLNLNSNYARQAIIEREQSSPNAISLDKFKKQVTSADHYYSGAVRSVDRRDSPKLTLVKDGKEVNNDRGGFSPGFGMGMSMGPQGLSSVTQQWSLLDENLLQPFVLPGQNLKIGTDGSLPIVTTYSAAQEILKLDKLPRDASAKEQKSRLEQVRRDIAGKTFQLCYRNNTAQQMHDDAVSQQEYIKQNSKKKDYLKPNLIYAPSDTPCGLPALTSDTRTAAEKDFDKRKEQFDRQFGKSDPASSLMTFRIVGVTQDSPLFGAGGVSLKDIISSVLSSSLGAQWVSPMSVEAVSVPAQDVFKRVPIFINGSQEGYFAEYSDAKTARNVIKTKTCRPTFGQFTPDSDTAIPTCSKDGTSFELGTFGSQSLAIDEFKNGFRKVQLWAALVVAIIASLILIGMVGRIIADARRETAVFRATGATRLMIAQIYLVYTLFLVALMLLIALALGFGVALVIHTLYSPDISIEMALTFNVADLSKQFRFYGIELYDLGIIAATILTAAIIGASVPIGANIQRNPIRDMRDE